jgi:pullulanase
LDWNLLDENYEDTLYVKELLRIRKKYDLFRLTAPSKVRDYCHVQFNDNGTIIYSLKDHENELKVIFKNNDEREMIHFDNKYTLIFDGKQRSRRVLSKLEVNDITTYILKRK